MTVGQLMEILKNFDGDSHVCVRVRYKDIYEGDDTLAIIGNNIDPEDIGETDDGDVMITAIEFE